MRDLWVFLSLEHLRAHCRITNWANFNIVVFQGIWKPEDRERDGETAVHWSTPNSHKICEFSSSSYMGTVHSTQNNYNSDIKDYWSQVTITNIIIMEKVEILWEFPKCDTETWKKSKCCWKNSTDRLAWCRGATNILFVKNAISVKFIKAKCIKAKYAYNDVPCSLLDNLNWEEKFSPRKLIENFSLLHLQSFMENTAK